MKKIILSVIFICSVSLWCTSCHESTDKVKEDNSRAGLVRMIKDYRIVGAEGFFDGMALDGFQSGDYTVAKKSKTAVAMGCNLTWEKMKLSIDIPHVPLSGKPANVSFDHISKDTKIRFSDMDSTESSEFAPPKTAVYGWIRILDIGCDSAMIMEDNSYKPAFFMQYRPQFACEVNIHCLLDGKLLRIKITAIEP